MKIKKKWMDNNLKKQLLRILFLTFVISLLSSATAFAKVTYREASVVSYDGTVKVIIAGGQKQYDAYKGMSLTQGDTLITSEDSSVTLYVDDDKEIKLGENSRLTISELSQYIDKKSKSTGLNLWFGKVWVNIKKKLNIRSKFEIKTGSTIMGVHGTIFYESYLPEANGSGQGQDSSGHTGYQTELDVLDGVVETTVTIPLVDAQGNTTYHDITVDVYANHRITFDDGVKNQDGIQMDKVTADSLDLLVLKALKELPQNEPQRIDPNLLNGIDQLIKQKEAEMKNDQGQSGSTGQKENSNTNPVYYGEDAEPSTPGTDAATPAVSMNDIENMTICEGDTDSRTVTVSPSTANITAAVSGASIAAVSVEGNKVNVQGKSRGTAKVTVTADKGGYISVSKQFTVTVLPPQGNETVTIEYPSTQPIKTQQGTAILMSATNHDDDLKSVKVSIRYGQDGLYLDGSSGSFTSETPVYLNAVNSASTWSVNLNGAPFTCAGEFECTITAIANDGKDGVPASCTMYVDNKAPQLITGSLPVMLNHEGSVTFDFSEVLSNEAKGNIADAIQKAVIFGNSNYLNFDWFYNTELNRYTLKVSNKFMETGIEFKDILDVTAVVTDLAGNSATVNLLKVYPIQAKLVEPQAVHVSVVSDGSMDGTPYRASEGCFMVTLPVGDTINENYINYIDNPADYVTLGGVLKKCTVDYLYYNSDTQQVCVNIYIEDGQDGYYLDSMGEGTITLSSMLYKSQDGSMGSAPLQASINFSATIDDLAGELDNPLSHKVYLHWTKPGSVYDSFTIYASTTSASEGFYPLSEGDNVKIYTDDGYAVLSNLTGGKTYWFKIVVTGDKCAGESNTFHIDVPIGKMTVEGVSGDTFVDLRTAPNLNMQSKTLTLNIKDASDSSVIQDANISAVIKTGQGNISDMATYVTDGNNITFTAVHSGGSSHNVTLTISREGYEDVPITFTLGVDMY